MAPDSTDLARHFNFVIIGDSTYDTNRYGMPLLHLIGRTGLNTSFSIGCVFLGGDNVKEYVQALGEISKIYPAGKLPATIAPMQTKHWSWE